MGSFLQRVKINCLVCGSLWRLSQLSICFTCEQQLWKSFIPVSGLLQNLNSQFKLETFSLFEWKENKSYQLNELIMSLKGGHAPFCAYDFLAEKLFEQRLFCRPLLEKICLVTPPSRNGKKDHAFLLAERLSNKMQVPMGPKLIHVRSDLGRHQRQKNKRERREIVFEVCKDSRVMQGAENYFFVDDVITTGGTALAAWRALGSPKNFEILTLARRLLAGSKPL